MSYCSGLSNAALKNKGLESGSAAFSVPDTRLATHSR